MSDDVHPCDEALAIIHEMAISFAIQSRHDVGLILAGAYQQVQQYLIGEDDRIAEAVEAAKQREQAEYSKVILIMAEKVEAARREERRACWKIADDEDSGNPWGADIRARRIASRIRARSTPSGKPAEPVGPTK